MPPACKFALIKIGPGDYLWPSNDGRVMWRFVKDVYWALFSVPLAKWDGHGDWQAAGNWRDAGVVFDTRKEALAWAMDEVRV
jgi:hypothetical protein